MEFNISTQLSFLKKCIPTFYTQTFGKNNENFQIGNFTNFPGKYF